MQPHSLCVDASQAAKTVVATVAVSFALGVNSLGGVSISATSSTLCGSIQYHHHDRTPCLQSQNQPIRSTDVAKFNHPPDLGLQMLPATGTICLPHKTCGDAGVPVGGSYIHSFCTHVPHGSREKCHHRFRYRVIDADVRTYRLLNKPVCTLAYRRECMCPCTHTPRLQATAQRSSRRSACRYITGPLGHQGRTGFSKDRRQGWAEDTGR